MSVSQQAIFGKGFPYSSHDLVDVKPKYLGHQNFENWTQGGRIVLWCKGKVAVSQIMDMCTHAHARVRTHAH